jgi:hypothetical protein
MKDYYKYLNENGEIIMLFTYDFEPIINNPSMIQITEEEYMAIKNDWETVIAENANKVINETALKAQAYDIIMGEAQ